MSDEPILAATELQAGYIEGVPILDGCSVELYQGEIVGIIGPNGAGKSTLIKAIFGLVSIWKGTVTLHGREITNRKAHELVASGVGYVPQTDNIFPRLTVRENLEMGLFLRPRAWKERYAFVVDLFPLLKERASQRAGALSGGERQMVAMARALMMDPEVLLLDEPSAGLAPSYQDLVFDHVVAINRAGVAILMVEQNARRCLQIASRGYVLEQGRNAHEGSGQELLHDDRVIQLYLGTLRRGGGEAPPQPGTA